LLQDAKSKLKKENENFYVFLRFFGELTVKYVRIMVPQIPAMVGETDPFGNWWKSSMKGRSTSRPYMRLGPLRTEIREGIAT